MTAHSKSNARLQVTLDEMIPELPTYFKAHALSRKINKRNRSLGLNPNRVGQILKQRMDVRSLGNGMWEKVT